MLLKTVPAVYRAVPVGLEGNFIFLSTISTSDLVHLSRGSVVTAPVVVVSSVAHSKRLSILRTLRGRGVPLRQGKHQYLTLCQYDCTSSLAYFFEPEIGAGKVSSFNATPYKGESKALLDRVMSIINDALAS